MPTPPPPNSNQNTHNLGQPRQDFTLNPIENLLYQKGVDVTIEKALQCPCKSGAQNQQTSCLNCGGSGWIFVNSRKTRIVLTGLNSSKDYEQWSEYNKGIINFSCPQDEDIAFMDRITRLNAKSQFNEVITFKQKQSGLETIVFAHLVYTPKLIEYVGLYISDVDPLVRLIEGTDFTINNNKIVLMGSMLEDYDFSEGYTATVRYTHAPTFNVWDLKRESFDNYTIEQGATTEKLQFMPISGVAKRTHAITDFKDLSGAGLNNNDYTEHC